jgi:cytochrome d ubiquinol oxidase subunit II
VNLAALWFALAAVMVAIYVVMDGFDFGAGVLHLLVARSDGERRQVLGAIGPFWDGNEVWLLAAGGVLFLAFPRVLGAGLSGFYLAIMMVLWVLILRGIAIEFRSHLADRLWRQFWDGTFALASVLAPILFGAAIGNLVRGVPMQANGWFALPLFASFSPRGALGILDWYTVLTGVFALVTLTQHGANFLAWRTEGPVRERSRAMAARLEFATLGLWVLVTVATAYLAPEVFRALVERPLAWLATAVFIGGFVAASIAHRRGNDLVAFIGTGAFVLGLLAATAACVFPVMLRSAGDAALSLTAFNASSGPSSLAAGLWWWPVGFVIAVGYVALLFRAHRAKVRTPAGSGY